MSKVILYIATSNDGFIARQDGGIDWLGNEMPDIPNDSFDYKNFIETIDCIIMGSASYVQILGFGEWPYPGKEVYIISSRNDLDNPHPDVSISNSIPEVLSKLNDKRIWLLGGAKLAKSFDDHNLIDELMITILTNINLGDGIKLELDYSKYKTIVNCKINDQLSKQHLIKSEIN